MEEAQVPATETAVEAPVTTEVETSPVESGTTETVVETAEEKEVKRLAEEKQKGERAKRSIQKRFSEYSEALKQKDRQIEQLVQAVTGKQQAPQTPTDQPPAREQYGTYEEFIEAKAAYRAEKAAEQRLSKMLQDAQAQQQQTAAARAQQEHAKSLQEFAEKTPDFYEVVNREDVQVPDALQALLPHVPNAAQVLYAIGKNPALAAELNKHAGNPAALLFAMGRIASAPEPAPQISNAPPAGKPVGAKAGASNDPPTNPDAYMAWRKKNLR